MNGVKGASARVSQVCEWWDANPLANIGIATGSVSGIIALDVDPRNGGDETLRSNIQSLGRLNCSTISRTGGAGSHYIFRMPKFDVRKDSGERFLVQA